VRRFRKHQLSLTFPLPSPPRKLCVQVWLLGVQGLGAKEQSGGGECLVLVEAEDLAAVPQVPLQSRVWRGKQGVVRIRVLVECACVVAGGCDASETTVASHSFFAVARSAAPLPVSSSCTRACAVAERNSSACEHCSSSFQDLFLAPSAAGLGYEEAEADDEDDDDFYASPSGVATAFRCGPFCSSANSFPFWAVSPASTFALSMV
jgi:hypothetical protein